MAEAYVGEIRMFAGNYAPVGWHLCDGGLLAIADYNALYNLIGTTYGGNGTSNFAVPDLRGRVPVSAGTGAGLSTYYVGEPFGVENVTISLASMPAHNHPFNATSTGAANPAPTPGGTRTLGTSPSNTYLYAKQATPPIALEPLNAAAVVNAGGNVSHTNIMPVLAITYIISLYGIYPQFN